MRIIRGRLASYMKIPRSLCLGGDDSGMAIFFGLVADSEADGAHWRGDGCEKLEDLAYARGRRAAKEKSVFSHGSSI